MFREPKLIDNEYTKLAQQILDHYDLAELFRLHQEEDLTLLISKSMPMDNAILFGTELADKLMEFDMQNPSAISFRPGLGKDQKEIIIDVRLLLNLDFSSRSPKRDSR